MSKPCLAVFTCHKPDFHHDYIQDWFKRPVVVEDRVSAVRDTWFKDVDIPKAFIYGRPPRGMDRQPKDDELFLECPDGYYGSAHKVKAMIQCALDDGFDRIFKIDDDVYLHWDRLKASRDWDTEAVYVGGGIPHLPEYWCSGAFYGLTRYAMEILANTPIGDNDWAEDRWVGRTLAKHNLDCRWNFDYYVEVPTDRTVPYIDQELMTGDHSYITLHALSPDMMREYYAREKSSATEASGHPAPQESTEGA